MRNLQNCVKVLLHIIFTIVIGCSERDLDIKPNFVFLFADDLAFNAIGYQGNSVVHTPNIDRLAKLGTSFSHTYNMGGWNGAICVASRAMIISGQSIWNAEKTTKKWESKDTASINKTWGKLLQNSGYQTYMSGKWHVNLSEKKVFENTGITRPGMPGDRFSETPFTQIRETYIQGENTNNLFPVGYARPTHENDALWHPADTIHGGFWEGGKHWSEALVDDAFEFLDSAQKNENPFFMYLAFNAPHDPRQAPQEYLDLYSIETIELPPNYSSEYPYRDDIGNEIWLRDEALAPFPRTPYSVKTHIREYYAIISHLDAQIGRILDALKESNLSDNTYIIFTADHGLSVGSHGLLGKQNMYDHSIRVPFIIAGPNIPSGQISTQDIYLQDVMPTTLELAGIDKPEDVYFHSLLNIINGDSQNGNYSQGIYGAYMNLQRMIRKGKYKLIVYPKIQKTLLFDLETDPYELSDLSEETAYSSILDSLLFDLRNLQIELNDSIDLQIYDRVVPDDHIKTID